MGQSEQGGPLLGRTGWRSWARARCTQQNQNKQFDRIDLAAKIMAPPPIKFQDLEQFMASSKILTGPPFLFDVRTDYVKVTNDTVIVPITMQMKNSDITFNTKDGVSTGKVEIQGRVSNMTHKIMQTFGDTVEVRYAERAAGGEAEGRLRCTGRRCRCVRGCIRSIL